MNTIIIIVARDSSTFFRATYGHAYLFYLDIAFFPLSPNYCEISMPVINNRSKRSVTWKIAFHHKLNELSITIKSKT